MRRNLFRATFILVLVILVAVSAALLAGSGRSEDLDEGKPDVQYRVTPAVPFQQCPWPPCAAPCVLGAPPEVLCKGQDGSVSQTTFFCCCCGSGTNQYKPL